MTKNKPVKTVSTTCPCGAQFDREVKRGRPQVWCPACLVTPFQDRVRVAPVVTDVGDVVEAAPVRPYDDLRNVRDQLEADVASFYAETKGTLDGDAQLKGLQAIYARYR